MKKESINIIFTTHLMFLLFPNKQQFMKLSVFLISIIMSMSVSAQWRVQFQTGLSSSLQRQSADSLFAAKNQGLHSQLRVEYYFGHFGIGLAAGYINRKVRADAGKTPSPSFLNALNNYSVSNAGLRSVYLLAGPEFCFACGRRLKLNFGIRAGVSFLKKEGLQITDQNVVIYKNTITSKAPFTFNMGIGGHYFINNHIGIGAKVDYHSFKVRYSNNDFRRGITNNITLQQLQQLLNTGVSFTYKF